MNIATEMDVKVYGRLLARTVPTVIKTKDEHLRVLAIVEKLMAQGEGELSREEEALLELLVDLVHDYEEQEYPLRKSKPHEMAGFLLAQRGLKQIDLWEVLGSKGRVSELLSGKREISKEQAKKLAVFFRVPVGLFL